MPAFPRAIWSAEATPPKMPGAALSRGPTGGIQARNAIAIGRIWEESWPAFDARSLNGRALLEFVNRAWNQGLIFDIVHPDFRTPIGAAGGVPLVNGAGQTGATLNTDGWTASQLVFRQGDLFRIANLNPVFQITADISANGSGQAALPIAPIIVVGNSPADNAALTVTAVTFRAVIISEPGMPRIGPSGVTVDPLTLQFAEAA